jgi:hypothetical protein
MLADIGTGRSGGSANFTRGQIRAREWPGNEYGGTEYGGLPVFTAVPQQLLSAAVAAAASDTSHDDGHATLSRFASKGVVEGREACLVVNGDIEDAAVGQL